MPNLSKSSDALDIRLSIPRSATLLSVSIMVDVNGLSQGFSGLQYLSIT